VKRETNKNAEGMRGDNNTFLMKTKLFIFRLFNKSFKIGLTLEPISKFLFIIGLLPVVIPAQAGIHVFQGFKMDPRFREGDGFFATTYFEISSNKKISPCPSFPKRGVLPPFGKGRVGGILWIWTMSLLFRSI
jgi:MoaA/NifB/PqqE/SkfB family radical SAM enzyme